MIPGAALRGAWMGRHHGLRLPRSPTGRPAGAPGQENRYFGAPGFVRTAQLPLMAVAPCLVGSLVQHHVALSKDPVCAPRERAGT